MSENDHLIPRDYPIPVSVRRPLPAAQDPALLPPQAAPPAQVAPHIIYINNSPATVPMPATVPLAPQPPAPAQEIHHHHYNSQHTTHKVSYRLPKPPSHSGLGTASLALGIIACVVCWVPWLGLVAVPVGAIGAVLGILGVLVSLLFRKSSAGLPMSGVFVCCLAAGISVASTKSLPFWRGQLDRALTAVLPPALAPAHTTAPADIPMPAPLRPPNLLDFGSTPKPPTPAPVTPLPTAPQVGTPKPGAAPRLDPAIAAARDQLAAAETACDQRTMQTSQYQLAVKAAADARARETLLRQNAPGSADLIQASHDMIQADNAVSDTLTRAQASDTGVITARQALIAAHAAAQH